MGYSNWRESRRDLRVQVLLGLGIALLLEYTAPLLVALFAVRLAVMLPLYLGGEVAWLGVGRVVLGWPAYLLAVVVMGWLLAVGRTAQTADGDDDVTERMERAHEEHEQVEEP